MVRQSSPYSRRQPHERVTINLLACFPMYQFVSSPDLTRNARQMHVLRCHQCDWTVESREVKTWGNLQVEISQDKGPICSTFTLLRSKYLDATCVSFKDLKVSRRAATPHCHSQSGRVRSNALRHASLSRSVLWHSSRFVRDCYQHFATLSSSPTLLGPKTLTQYYISEMSLWVDQVSREMQRFIRISWLSSQYRPRTLDALQYHTGLSERLKSLVCHVLTGTIAVYSQEL